MTQQIQIARDLRLPLDLVTQAIGILAKRRAGKSYTAAKLTEQLFTTGQQVVVVDPKGDWWGLRSSADGTRPGLPILILGGEHGDLPLEVHAGELIAQLVVEEGVSALLDLSVLRKHEVAVFMTGFLETLYRLKAQERYRTPLMLIIDEADAIAPQRPQKGEERMLGAAEDIVRRGGQRGIGCTMATQRAAILNKNVLTQIEVLVALRTIAPQDLAAVGDWIDVHGTPEQRRELLESLPSLPVGTAWFWSPGWPTDAGIFQRVQVAQRETYDSSATPKPGERRVAPKSLADVNLGALRERMAATIERVQADDPRALRRRIVELERELHHAQAQHAAPRIERVVERVEMPVVLAEDLTAAQALIAQMEQLAGQLTSHAEALRTTIAQAVEQPRPAPAVAPTWPAPAVSSTPLPAAPPTPDSGEKLALAERKILTVLAQHGPRSKKQVALLTGYAIKGGGFNNALSALRSRGYMTGTQELAITPAGHQALGSWEALPSGAALIDYWMGQLSKAERSILQVLVEAGGRALAKEDVAEAAGYEARGGGFNNALSRLRTLELIAGSRTLHVSHDLLVGAGDLARHAA